LAEEAIEVAQAAGVDKEMLHYLIEHVYKNPPGQLKQELGGLGVTILAMGHAAGIHVDQAEIDEIHRIVSKDPEHFRKRNEVKNKLGFKA
jgi:NTP pyrophosphatase (non-canonical NTP hydrolase)